MKLNQDCVRDLMLFVEENLTYSTYVNVSEVELCNYSTEEILYAADKLLEAQYFDGIKKRFLNTSMPDIRITSMTWLGHQFLDNIRDDGVWKHTKNILSKFSSASISLIGNVASQVITSLVQNQLGLH